MVASIFIIVCLSVGLLLMVLVQEDLRRFNSSNLEEKDKKMSSMFSAVNFSIVSNFEILKIMIQDPAVEMQIRHKRL